MEEELNVLSPGSPNANIIQMTDEDISEFIEFPPDTFFLESAAENSLYERGVAFLPAQRHKEISSSGLDWCTGRSTTVISETHIYKISPGMEHAEHVMGPLTAADGSAVTVFGSALCADGTLWVCAFNRNSIMAFDLTTQGGTPEGTPVACKLEVPGLAAPNDVCIDPEDDLTLYVAGGDFTKCCCFCCLCCCPFSNPTRGIVYKVQVDESKTNFTYDTMEEGFHTLAGIEVFDRTLWVAQLFNMVTVQGSDPDNRKTVWKGNDGNGLVWLADNVDTYADRYILCPAYSTQTEAAVDGVLERSRIGTAAIFSLQIATGCMRGESFRTAIQDPEVSLSFSNTFIKDGEQPPPIRLIFISSDGQQAYHFEIDLVQTRREHEPRDIYNKYGTKFLGQRHYFNEQVTHAFHFKGSDPTQDEGYICCISFEEPRVLLLKESAFKKHLF